MSAQSVLSHILLAAIFVFGASLGGQLSAQPLEAKPVKADLSVWDGKILGEGRSRFLFSGWEGPDLPVWAYIPEGVDKRTAPILIVMHGASRDPRRYTEEWIPFAEEDGFIIIAPEFSREDFRGSRKYNLGNMWERGAKAPNPPEIWSFSAIEPLFAQVVKAIGGNQTSYNLYGHSAGSQFVHRFLFLTSGARAHRFLPANAGWYTMPDPDIEFPYGLKGVGLSEQALKDALAKDVVILLGDADTDTQHESLRRTEEAMAQGPHRFARGLSYFARAKALADELDTEFNWSYRIIPGVAHKNGGIAAGAHDLVK